MYLTVSSVSIKIASPDINPASDRYRFTAGQESESVQTPKMFAPAGAVKPSDVRDAASKSGTLSSYLRADRGRFFTLAVMQCHRLGFTAH